MKKTFYALALWAFAIWISPAVFAAELVSLPTRPGVTQSYWLFARPHPKIIAVLFAGGDGALRLHRENGKVKFALKGNFLVRTRTLFRDDQFAVALVDAPSDHQVGMSDYFRMSRQHRQDIGAAVQDLRRRFPSAGIYLVGTSRGTVSVAHLGAALGKMIDGVVLTSTVFEAARSDKPGLSGFDFNALHGRVLLVHHVDDACPVTPYRDAQRFSRQFPLISVQGGLEPKTGECQGLSAHGYYGREAETIAAIKQWLLELPYPSMIGGTR